MDFRLSTLASNYAQNDAKTWGVHSVAHPPSGRVVAELLILNDFEKVDFLIVRKMLENISFVCIKLLID